AHVGLDVSETAALVHGLPRRLDVASRPSPADLLRELVDLTAQVVALGRQVSQLTVELGRRVELIEEGRIVPSRPGGLHPGHGGAQPPDVDRARRGDWRRLARRSGSTAPR